MLRFLSLRFRSVVTVSVRLIPQSSLLIRRFLGESAACSWSGDKFGVVDTGIDVPEHVPKVTQKEFLMSIASVWKSNKAGKRKNRPVSKPKIRWELLGLSDPDLTKSRTSIETIRKEVSSLARRGFGQGTRSRTTEQDGNGRGRSREASAGQVRRRGATD